MARTFSNVGHPVDQAPSVEPGVAYRMREFHGRGHSLTLPPESKIRADQGDLGLIVIPDFQSKPLTKAGLPFTLKGKGK